MVVSSVPVMPTHAATTVITTHILLPGLHHRRQKTLFPEPKLRALSHKFHETEKKGDDIITTITTTSCRTTTL